jgi:hypothetical protein
VRDFLFRLFFTRDDDLDVLQLLFLAWSVFLMWMVERVGSGAWTLPTAVWATVSGFLATLAISAVPKWLAPLLASRKEPQIMSVQAPYYDTFTGRVDDPDA